jgi:hypothetical protein
MQITRKPGEPFAEYAARARQVEAAVGCPAPPPTFAGLFALAAVAPTESRALNPCGQIAGGRFGSGNTCAAGDGSDTPEVDRILMVKVPPAEAADIQKAAIAALPDLKPIATDDLHVTLLGYGLADGLKGKKLPPLGFRVTLDPSQVYVVERYGKRSVFALVNEQEALRAYVGSLGEEYATAEPTRPFHVSVANRTGKPLDSVGGHEGNHVTRDAKRLSLPLPAESRALNPCGQVAGGLFGPGNTCAAGDGSAPAAETPAPSQTGGPQPARHKAPTPPPEFVGAAKSWEEVRKEHIKDFNRMRKRIIALQGSAKEKYLAAVEWRRNAQDAMEKWQEALDKAYLEEQVASEAATRASMDPAVSKEEKLALVETASKLAKIRIQIAMAGDDMQRDIDNAVFNYEKVKEANRNIAAKVLREEVGRVLREDGGKALEASAAARREQMEFSRTDPTRLSGDASKLIGGVGQKHAAASVAAYQASEAAQKNLEESDKFLRGIAHPLIHRRALTAPVEYDPKRDRASAGYGNDIEYHKKLVEAETIWAQGVAPSLDRVLQLASESSTAGTTYLNPGDSASTVAHEYGHQIEHANREARDLAWDFSIARTAGSPEVKLKEKYPDSIFTDDEIGRADDFAKAFAAARLEGSAAAEHSALYTGKRYESRRSTEIVSMGVELMKADGAAFAIADPEYFDLIAGILTGRALTQTRGAFARARQGTPINTGS